jgi:hypothetical protein
MKRKAWAGFRCVHSLYFISFIDDEASGRTPDATLRSIRRSS